MLGPKFIACIVVTVVTGIIVRYFKSQCNNTNKIVMNNQQNYSENEDSKGTDNSILFIIFLFGIAVLSFVAIKYSTPNVAENALTNSSSSTYSYSTTSKVAIVEELPITIELDDYLQSYKDNEIYAEQKFDGKRLAHYSFIQKIGRAENGWAFVELGVCKKSTNKCFNSICYFSKKNEHQLVSLKKGDAIKIAGYHKEGPTTRFTDCTVMYIKSE